MLHWMVWNIPARRDRSRRHPHGNTARRLAPDQRTVRTIAARARRHGPAHHYVFEIYALDAPIDVPAVGNHRR
jgi:phosphatidylethanolamine-binding protein (PEBP) family uncharacterized protein